MNNTKLAVCEYPMIFVPQDHKQVINTGYAGRYEISVGKRFTGKFFDEYGEKTRCITNSELRIELDEVIAECRTDFRDCSKLETYGETHKEEILPFRFRTTNSRGCEYACSKVKDEYTFLLYIKPKKSAITILIYKTLYYQNYLSWSGDGIRIFRAEYSDGHHTPSVYRESFRVNNGAFLWIGSKLKKPILEVATILDEDNASISPKAEKIEPINLIKLGEYISKSDIMICPGTFYLKDVVWGDVPAEYKEALPGEIELSAPSVFPDYTPYEEQEEAIKAYVCIVYGYRPEKFRIEGREYDSKDLKSMLRERRTT